jgi:hypothetical protein
MTRSDFLARCSSESASAASARARISSSVFSQVSRKSLPYVSVSSLASCAEVFLQGVHGIRGGCQAARPVKGASAARAVVGRCLLDGVDDLLVAGAAAEVAVDGFADLLPRRAGCLSRNACATRIMPGVQNPHWIAPRSRKARCSGCSARPGRPCPRSSAPFSRPRPSRA